MEDFEKIIEKYISAYMAKDSNLAKKKEESKKTYKGCANYIINEVKKKKKGNVGVLSDEECYGLMVHYFDEDSIKEEQPKPQNVKVTTSSTTKTTTEKKGTTQKTHQATTQKATSSKSATQTATQPEKAERKMTIKPIKKVKEEELTLSLF